LVNNARRWQIPRVRSLACAGAGFLLCVLWFDLMFDVQARGHPDHDVPASVRTSIATYYARVTTAARPMSGLIVVAMGTTIVATVGVIARDELPAWRAGIALLLTVGAVGLALGRTVRNAQRLGRQDDGDAHQSKLARMILRDHVLCFAAIAAVLVLQLLPA
jgi:hypothetical protein